MHLVDSASEACICDKCDTPHSTSQNLRVFEPIDVLRAFRKAYEFHTEMERALNPGTRISFDSNADDAIPEYWYRIALVSNFRKFLLNSRDAVYLPRVLECLLELGAVKSSEVSATDFRLQVNSFRKGGPLLGAFGLGDGQVFSAHKIVDALLYGRVLHHDSWADERISHFPIQMRSLAMAEWLETFRQHFEVLNSAATRYLASIDSI